MSLKGIHLVDHSRGETFPVSLDDAEAIVESRFRKRLTPEQLSTEFKSVDEAKGLAEKMKLAHYSVYEDDAPVHRMEHGEQVIGKKDAA